MFPKGGMGGILKQAKEMQKNMDKAKKEIELIEVTGLSSQDFVKIRMSGNKKLIDVQLSPQILKEDHEIIEDYILIAFNDAIKQANEISKQKMNEATGGLMQGNSIPGLM